MAKSEAATMLSLQSIYLRSGTVDMRPDFFPNLPGTPMVPLFRTADCQLTCNTSELQAEDGSEQTLRWCQFISRFQFVYVKPKDDGSTYEEHEIEKHQLASITADIAAIYHVSGDDFPDQEKLLRWATHNVVLHTWPYWREYCHSTLQRMGLPITLIPLINIAPPAEEAASAD